MQIIDELKGERKKLLKLSNDCLSEYKWLKSYYENLNYKWITEDKNNLYFHTGNIGFSLWFCWKLNKSDTSKLTLYAPTPQNGQIHSNNCVSVSDHFVGLALKRLTKK